MDKVDKAWTFITYFFFGFLVIALGCAVVGVNVNVYMNYTIMESTPYETELEWFQIYTFDDSFWQQFNVIEQNWSKYIPEIPMIKLLPTLTNPVINFLPWLCNLFIILINLVSGTINFIADIIGFVISFVNTFITWTINSGGFLVPRDYSWVYA